MATPKWFDANAYMQNKLAQLKAQEPDAGWTLDNLYDAFREGGFVGPEGQYEHFVKFGAAEEVAPNAYFNADEYYAAKAHEYYGDKFDGSEEQIATVKAMIKDAGMNAWTHYQQFGSAEGVNPSNAFDASDYCAAKAEAMNKAGQKDPDGNDWTAESIAKAIDDAGMSVLEHYLTYAGTGEGEVAAGSTYPVSEDEQVVVSKPGETFFLTDKIDDLKGTAGDDVFKAADGTLNAGDSVDGGAGNDTLEVYTDDTLAGTFTNIENLVVAGTAAAASYDLSSFSKSFTLKADAATKVMNVAGQKLVMDGVGVKALTVEMAADQASVELVSQNRTGDNTFFLGKGDALKSVSLTLDEDAYSVKFNGSKARSIETLAVKAVESSTTDVATVDLTLLTGLKDITVTGDASVTLSAVNKAIKLETLDASNTTGGVTVNGKLADTAAFTGGEGNDTITLGTSTKAHDMGAGDDTVVLNGSALGKDGSVDGGDGVDTLLMTATNAVAMTADNFKAFTNFEELALSDQLGANINMANFAGIDHLTLAGTSKAVTVSNMQSGSTLELGDDTTGGITVDVDGAAAGQDDVLNIVLSKDAALAANKVTVKDVETINIVADDSGEGAANATHTMTLTADKATTVKVSGDAGLTLTLKGSDAVKTIDASESTGNVTISGTLKGVAFTGGDGNDTVTLGAGNTVTGGAGNDTFIINKTAVNDRSVITDFGADDKIKMGTSADGSGDGNALGDALVVNDPKATLADYVTAATATATESVAWFQYEGNTYVVVNSGVGFDASADYIVQLSGSVDLSDAVMSNGSLTLPEGA